MMRRALRSFLVLLLVVSGVAYAVQCTQYATRTRFSTDSTATGWYDDKAGACGKFLQTMQGQIDGNGQVVVYTMDPYFSDPDNCRIINPNGTTAEVAGYATRTGDFCNPCIQGEKQTKLVLMGHARATARSDGALWATMDGRNYFAPMGASPMSKPLPSELCDGTCALVADGAAGDWYHSADPLPSGLFPVHRAQGYMKTGGLCSVKTPAIDPAEASKASCDGSVGQINGKTVCVAKVPPAGFDGWKPKITASGTGTVPQQATDTTGPIAMGPNGEKPGRAGDAPGLTDLSGTGTAGGGGGASSTPSSGTETRSDGTTSTFKLDIQTCGMPGKPACKMDESGTPDGKGSITDSTLKAEADKLDGALTSIQNKGDKDTSWSMPTWFQAGGCNPWQLGTFPIINVPINVDICAIKPYVDGVLTFLWLVGTFLATLAMITRVMMGPARS